VIGVNCCAGQRVVYRLQCEPRLTRSDDMNLAESSDCYSDTAHKSHTRFVLHPSFPLLLVTLRLSLHADTPSPNETLNLFRSGIHSQIRFRIPHSVKWYEPNGDYIALWKSGEKPAVDDAVKSNVQRISNKVADCASPTLSITMVACS
jgi:hypothetical protein